MASLLLARFARDTIERHLAEVGATLEERMESIHADDTVEVVAKAMFESNEGRLTRLIEIGAVDKTKRAAAYVHWFVEHNILPNEFSNSDALRFVSDTRRALALMSDQLAMRVGLALFRARAG
jgi:hypothetical protein